MDRRLRPEILWVFAISFLYLPLLYAYLTRIIQIQTPLIGPGHRMTFRLLLAAASVACFLFPWLIESRMRARPPDERRQPEPSPAVFLSGLAFFLAPICVAFFLFLLGNPKNDVYIWAVLSFAAILVWCWRQRRLLAPTAREVLDGTVDEKEISPAGLSRPPDGGVMRSYTITLAGVGLLFLAVLLIRVLWVMNSPQRETGALFLKSPLNYYDTVVIVGCWTAALLRRRASPLSPVATKIASSLLAAGFPWGTAVFFYWWAVVRKKERS